MPPLELRSEALAIFDRTQERLDHLGVLKVAAELIQLRQPEVVPGIVRVLWIIRIASQVTKELHQDKRAIELGVHKIGMLGYESQHLGPCSGA